VIEVKPEKKEVRCPYCTQRVGMHPSGVMVPHTTRRNGSGEDCYGSRSKP
jgi:C4-type Zn-finger protein